MTKLKTALGFYWRYMKVYPWHFLVLLFTVILFTVTYNLAPTYLGKTVQDLTNFTQGQHGTMDTFQSDLLIMAVLFILSAIGDASTSFVMSWVGGRSTQEMRNDLFGKMQRMKVGYFDSHSDGDVLARFTSDLDNIFNAMNEAFVQLIYSAAQIIGVLIIMLRMNVPLALVTMSTTPVTILIAAYVIRRANRAIDEQQADIGKLNGYINEQITGQKLIIANNLQKDSLAGFGTRNADVQQTSTSGQIWSGTLQPVMNGMMLLTTAIVVFFGSWLVLQGNLQTGAALALVVVYVQFAQNYFQPLVAVTSVYNQLQLAMTGARRVEEVHHEDDEPRPANGLPVPKTFDAVRIEDVHFGYKPDVEILHGITITAPHGKMIAVVGPTGAGKTTLINLLNRFYDVDSGHILIGETDIRDIDLHALRQEVGIVLQDPQMFSGTIASNIAFGKPDASMDEIREAARTAQLDDYIMGLPQGYDTPVSDEQSILSAGQKQLLSIARTLLVNPPILILDEATSNVDTVTESLIQTAMDRLIVGRTSFVIAHRLKTVLNADNIVVIRDGAITESGTHQELLAADGFYAGLYKSQTIFD
ncbi:ABC transporter ATP-binding protein [Lacticaseibacillus pabuli]|uniref:ABC transporter ATP-binding protein n=1 Tax=Lacticaseibacillus pabuli TaxID=3025672 RepID=A0ABY7WUZ0_9LACO|nr:ABC transporter ATP-binding protein [Lacticaseibacillus sp. KACC 23028]WDF82970.1 ABC transporter ATP-binding protein [Lacticaseibacillus sp. KACC 23028]